MANFRGFLTQALPWIGAAATGNVPALANLAIQKIADVTGKKISTPDEAAAAVAGATPDQIVALRKIDDDFAVQMRQLNIQSVDDLIKLGNDDLASARNREVQLRDRFVPILASVVVGSFVTAVVAVLCGVSRVEAAFAGTLIGYLSANCTQVVSYYFGSSNAHDKMTATAKLDGGTQ